MRNLVLVLLIGIVLGLLASGVYHNHKIKSYESKNESLEKREKDFGAKHLKTVYRKETFANYKASIPQGVMKRMHEQGMTKEQSNDMVKRACAETPGGKLIEVDGFFTCCRGDCNGD